MTLRPRAEPIASEHALATITTTYYLLEQNNALNIEPVLWGNRPVADTLRISDMQHDLTTILRAIPLFKTLDDTEVAELVKMMAHQDFTATQPILVEGHPPPGLYVILDGRVAVMKSKAGDADHICDFDAGECVGELEIIEKAACSASVVALGDVKTAVITSDNLERFFTANPVASNKILRQMVVVLAARLRKANINYSSLKTLADAMSDE